MDMRYKGDQLDVLPLVVNDDRKVSDFMQVLFENMFNHVLLNTEKSCSIFECKSVLPIVCITIIFE